jgi:hypothetical protein
MRRGEAFGFGVGFKCRLRSILADPFVSLAVLGASQTAVSSPFVSDFQYQVTDLAFHGNQPFNPI